jgi:hypothetical protein
MPVTVYGVSVPLMRTLSPTAMPCWSARFWLMTMVC